MSCVESRVVLLCVISALFVFPIVVLFLLFFFFFQAEDGIRDDLVTGVQTCALPIYRHLRIAGLTDIPEFWD